MANTQSLWTTETVAANLNALSLEARERAAKDAAKKEARAAQAETREQERKAASKVTIRRVERNKRKHVTVLMGLEAHGLDNKKVAKELGKKFATGSSVTKATGSAISQGLSEEITVQGDVSDEIFDWLLEVYGEKVPEENIEMVEDKKKKSTPAAWNDFSIFFLFLFVPAINFLASSVFLGCISGVIPFTLFFLHDTPSFPKWDMIKKKKD